MSEEIIKILDALSEKFGVVIDWNKSNTIPYFEELCGKFCNYKIGTSIIWLVIGLIIMFVTLYVYKSKYFKDWLKYREDDILDYYIIFLLICLVDIVIVFYNIYNIVTCVTFPEKLIIEELTAIYRRIR